MSTLYKSKGHADFANVKDIPEAILAGQDVRWKNDGYVVDVDRNGVAHITFTSNNSTVLLFWQDGETSDYNPADFYIKRD